MIQKRNSDTPEIQPARPVVFGEVLFDCFGEREVPGGAPLNVAWHLQALGWSPLLISRIGEDDQGRRITRRMQDWGMDTSGVQHDRHHPTGRVEVKMEGKNHSFHILAEQAYDFIESKAALRAVNSQQVGVLCHGSLALRADSGDAFSALSDAVDTPIFLDINLRDPWWKKDSVLEMISRTDHLKLNDEELRLLCPASLKDEPLEEAAIRVCTEWTLDTLWLTRGAKGAFYCSADGGQFAISPMEESVSIVDTVGAGDAFSAALLGGLLKGSAPRDTAQCAALLAARVCGQQGATGTDPGLYRGLEAVTHDRSA